MSKQRIKKKLEKKADEKWFKMRWESAKTTRTNQKHWSYVNGNTINHDLNDNLEILRQRCRYEAENNGFIKGIIETVTGDVVGKTGPVLRVTSSDSEYNEQVERLWRRMWNSSLVDYNGENAGPEKLRLWIRGLFTDGEFLEQLTTGDERESTQNRIPRLRLYGIPAERLASPTDMSGTNNVVMGVERTDTGRPIQYWIADAKQQNWYYSVGKYTAINAKNLIHAFVPLEPSQARGVPWLASVLNVIQEVRDYDSAVLQAARVAALFSVGLYTDHPDLTYNNPGEVEVEIAAGTMWTAPPGWKMTGLDPKQPTTTYREYRNERLLEIGRPVNMPLMLVKLDSADHNYSSARFDDQAYRRGLQNLEGFLERKALIPFVKKIVMEAELMEILTRRTPQDVEYTFIWPPASHVDPVKEAEGQAIRLQNCTTTLQKELALDGEDLEGTLLQQEKEMKLLEEMGIPSPFGRKDGQESQQNDSSDSSETKQDDTKEKNGRRKQTKYAQLS